MGIASQVFFEMDSNVMILVKIGVANGSACTMHSLAWDNPEDEKDACKAIAKGEPGQIIDLPTPPDHMLTSSQNKIFDGLNI
jgi:hypothetical protein